MTPAAVSAIRLDAPRQTSDRLHALDAVRGFALLAGVVLHATMSFLPGFGATGWPIVDSSSSVALGVTFYVIHMFRMTTFFLIAGFFGHMMLHRHGVRAFVRNRATRILVPFAVGWIVLFPLVATAMVQAGLTRPAGGPPPQTALLSFPLAHLWFLYVLTLMYAATLAVREGIVERVDRNGALRGGLDRAVRLLVTWPVGLIVLAAPVWVALITTPEWKPWFGIPTPDQSLIPNMPAMVAFGTAFVFGWLLHRQPDLLRTCERRWALHLILAAALTAACLSMQGLAPAFGSAPTDRRLLTYAALYTVAVWSWTFALIGTALRFFSGASEARRYVADASYWIYLVHLPLVFFLQVAVMRLPWPWSVKFPVILGSAFVLLFASYHLVVRFTFIGEVLNGRRYRRARADAATAVRAHASTMAGTASVDPGGAPASGGMAVLSGVRKKFGKIVALDGLSLEVRRGELLAVLGPNGAGKSTAISLLMGLLEPDEGSARLFDQSPALLEPRYQIGVMMQEVSLAPELRVRELIALTGSYYPSPMTPAEAMALTHTASLAERPYGKLSPGQKRQVQFALAVCGRPALLFLDEPTVGLDVQARELLWGTLRTLIADGASIVLTTHYLEEAEALADRVAVLAKGRLIASGSVDDMRALVERKRIRCVTTLSVDEVRTWTGVTTAQLESSGRLQIVATDADSIVRRLFATDAQCRDLEVQRAGLAEAFAELTQEAA